MSFIPEEIPLFSTDHVWFHRIIYALCIIILLILIIFHSYSLFIDTFSTSNPQLNKNGKHLSKTISFTKTRSSIKTKTSTKTLTTLHKNSSTNNAIAKDGNNNTPSNVTIQTPTTPGTPPTATTSININANEPSSGDFPSTKLDLSGHTSGSENETANKSASHSPNTNENSGGSVHNTTTNTNTKAKRKQKGPKLVCPKKSVFFSFVFIRNFIILLCMIQYLFLCLIQGSLYFELYWFVEKLNTNSCEITQILLALFWHYANIATYLIFLFRAQVAFKNSKYEWSNSVIYGTFIFIILFFITSTIGDFIEIRGKWQYDNKYTNIYICNAMYAQWGIFVNAFFDSIVSLICLYLFVKPLRLLIESRRRVSGAHEKVSYENRERQIKLSNLTVKLSLLTFITISSTFFLFSFILFWGLGGFAALDGVINCVCLMLMEKFYSQYYNVFCATPHRFCMRMQKNHMDDKTDKSDNWESSHRDTNTGVNSLSAGVPENKTQLQAYSSMSSVLSAKTQVSDNVSNVSINVSNVSDDGQVDDGKQLQVASSSPSPRN